MSPNKPGHYCPHPFIFFFAVIFLVAFSSIPATATDISFANLNLIEGYSILVYNSSGSFVGEYNLTSTGTFNEPGYVFIFKPTSQSWFTNPTNAITLFTIWLPAMMSYLIWAVVIIATGYMITRIFK